MIQSEVINKLARECCLALGDFDHFTTVHTYIQMALSIGIEHYTKDMEEIVAMYRDGVEAGRFKSIREAERKLGIDRRNINQVLRGAAHSAGGLIFIKTKDYELIERKKERGQSVPPLYLTQTQT
jgi:hypothetical protein